MKGVALALWVTGVLITGCSGGDDDGATHQSTTNTMPAGEAVRFLERKGEIPALDRSKSLLGPDQDNNNVRDDIDSFISDLELSEEERSAARQFAQALQSTLIVDLSDEQAKHDIRTQIGRSIVCASDSFEDYDEKKAVKDRLQSITFNTKERTDRYIKFNQAMSGSSTRMPSGDTCEN